MTTLTMAQCATAHAPVRITAISAFSALISARNANAWSKTRVIHLCAAACLGLGVQLITAGPAAVATLATRPVSRPPAVAAVTSSMPLARDPLLFASILEDAFPALERRPAGAARIEIKLPPEPEALAGLEMPVENPDELMNFGPKRAPRWLVQSILRAAQVTGVDPVYLMTLADVESSLSPEAKAGTSTAEGLFQFIDRTWLEIIYLHAADHGFTAAAEAVRMVDGEPVLVDEHQRSWLFGLRRDPYLSAVMAGELIKDMQRELQAQGERELAEAELYLAHFLGASSAVRFLAALDEQPDTAAAKLFPKAAKANLPLFTERHGRKRRPVTVAELYDRIDGKINRRLNNYDVVAQPEAVLTNSASAFDQAR